VTPRNLIDFSLIKASPGTRTLNNFSIHLLENKSCKVLFSRAIGGLARIEIVSHSSFVSNGKRPVGLLIRESTGHLEKHGFLSRSQSINAMALQNKKAAF